VEVVLIGTVRQRKEHAMTGNRWNKVTRILLIALLTSGLLCVLAGPANAMGDTILVPIQGVWRSLKGDVFTFTPGNSRDANDWVSGKVVGSAGPENVYQWKTATADTGWLYLDIKGAGRQGLIFVRLDNGNRTMTWQMGAEIMVLMRVN
jgi:hypothetical protein